MLEVPVYDIQGKQVDTIQVDEQALGGEVNASLVKQAVVAYQANSHQRTAQNRGRSDKEGSGKKLFRQKGTGNARRGNIRTNVMTGGGVAFAKRPYPVRKAMPRKMKRRALDSAVLAKLLGQDLLVVEELAFDQPRTKQFASILSNLSIDRSCLVALADRNDVVYRSARNIPKVSVRTVAELNAFDVATRQKMLLTRSAMDTLLQGR